MNSTTQFRIYLFWFLLLQCCVISVSIAAGSILLVASLFTLLLIVALEKKWQTYRTPLDYAFAGYIVVELISALTSVDPADAFKNSKRLLLIGIVYGVVISFTSEEKIRLSLKLIAGTVAVLSLVEIVLFFYQGTSHRLNVFQHYMTTGGLKMIVCLLTVPFILSDEIKMKERILYAATFLFIFAALILTNTRSAWLGLITGFMVMGALHFRRLFVVLAVLVVGFFLFAPEQQIGRAKSIIDLSHPDNAGRLHMWSTGLRMWQDKPLLGFGDIDLFASYSLYRTPTPEEPAGHLHNNYIHLLVTTGIIGLMAILFLFYKILQTEYRTFAQNKTNILVRNIALGALAVFSGFLVNGMFEWNFGDHEIMVFVWFTVGLCLAANKCARGNRL